MIELDQQKTEIPARVASDEPQLPHVNAGITEVYRRKVERMTDALPEPRMIQEAATAIRSLFSDITLTPGTKRNEIRAPLRGELMPVLDLAESRNATATSARRVAIGD